MTKHSTYKLAAHPTPVSGTADFQFATAAEMKEYTKFETARTGPEYSALGTALSPKQREAAKEALAKKRKAVYKLWKEQQKPIEKAIA